MATKQQGGDAGVLGHGGADHISGLPDHLLHSILLRLPRGTIDAARTSVLSRRWRRVWAHLSEISFLEPASSSSSRAVEAALASCAAPTVTRLAIAVPSPSAACPAARVSGWLRFAARRLAGNLRLSLPAGYAHYDKEQEEAVLPVCEAATSIDLHNVNRPLRFAAGGAFAALAVLRLHKARADGGELEDLLSSRCPRLRQLVLEWTALRDDDRNGGDCHVISIRSGSLRELEIKNNDEFEGLLQVVTPELRSLR
ncbi:hypothetical protein QOZ80_7BG0602720 [Eleusine coracana subsp. coracana]|nr:hypothetical protein QOZ80_7BG0602720 [Eleusine coracana subsp. coracana]